MQPEPTRQPRRPSPAELVAANGRAIPDVIAPDLRVLFCGINPGRYSGATGRHFARPGNRFWPTLHAAGFTDRLLTPWDGTEMLEAGFGITNLVNRTAFQRPTAAIGRQPEDLGPSALWVLPNPSGLNAHYQLPALADIFRALRESLEP